MKIVEEDQVKVDFQEKAVDVCVRITENLVRRVGGNVESVNGVDRARSDICLVVCRCEHSQNDPSTSNVWYSRNAIGLRVPLGVTTSEATGAIPSGFSGVYCLLYPWALFRLNNDSAPGRVRLSS